MGCEVIVNNFQTDTSSGDPITTEHGLFTKSQMVLKDVYLLGHADYLVGTTESTFSSLIQNFIAFNALQKNITLLTSTFISRGGGDVHLLKGLNVMYGSINGGRLRGTSKQGLDCREMWNNT
jgi:hypothetical protein